MHKKLDKKWYRILALILAVILIGSAGYVILKNVDYQRGVQVYDAAADIAAVPVLPEVPLEEEGEEAAEIPEELLDILADVDLGALREVNGEVAGWIAIPGTEVSYPVLQGEDNRYYLNHTWNRVQSAVGSVFLECRCAPDLTDFNTIVYGHRMKNGTMFGRLRDYNKEDFWRQHPVVYLVTDEHVYVYDIYAAFEAGVTEIIYRLDLTDEVERRKMIAFALSRSAIDTGITPTAEDRVVTLSTCTGRGHATRWVVQGVLQEQIPREAE